MNTDAVQTMVIQPLRAKRAWAIERQAVVAGLSAPHSLQGQALLHGQAEYLAGKVQAYDEAIELVEHRLRVEGTLHREVRQAPSRDDPTLPIGEGEHQEVRYVSAWERLREAEEDELEAEARR